MTSEQRIIYITGRGGDAGKGLGAYLKTIDPHRIGLSVNSIFLSLPFEQQISTIHDLLHRFDSPNTSIIAHSYGAYLLLQAMLALGAMESRVILLSPVMGRGMVKSSMLMSRPPGEYRVVEAQECGDVLAGTRVSVHVGEHDDSVNICDISKRLGITNITVVQKAGHNLPVDYIQRIMRPHY